MFFPQPSTLNQVGCSACATDALRLCYAYVTAMLRCYACFQGCRGRGKGPGRTCEASPQYTRDTDSFFHPCLTNRLILLASTRVHSRHTIFQPAGEGCRHLLRIPQMNNARIGINPSELIRSYPRQSEVNYSQLSTLNPQPVQFVSTGLSRPCHDLVTTCTHRKPLILLICHDVTTFGRGPGGERLLVHR
jgi:hypothetical protein